MVLIIDIGNTNATIGIFEKENLLFTSRLATDRKRTSDQYAVELLNIFKLNNAVIEDFSGAIISSVVPELTNAMKNAVIKVTNQIPVIIDSDKNTGLKNIFNKEGILGADLAAVAVGAIDKYPLPCFILDLGTATKIILVDKDGLFRGCTISPGVKISTEALADKTSMLPAIRLKTPEHSIGTNTIECMESGIILGTAAMLDGLTKRMEEEFGEKIVTTIATGGLSEEIVKNCEREIIYDKNLILHGLKSIYNKIKSK